MPASPAVPAGGPASERRIADDAALGRRLLHAAIVAGATLPLFHVLGAPGVLIDGLVRYLDAVVNRTPSCSSSEASGRRTHSRPPFARPGRR
jgi:hypothetical protein